MTVRMQKYYSKYDSIEFNLTEIFKPKFDMI